MGKYSNHGLPSKRIVKGAHCSGMRLCVTLLGKLLKPAEVLRETERDIEWVIKEGDEYQFLP